MSVYVKGESDPVDQGLDQQFVVVVKYRDKTMTKQSFIVVSPSISTVWENVMKLPVFNRTIRSFSVYTLDEVSDLLQ